MTYLLWFIPEPRSQPPGFLSGTDFTVDPGDLVLTTEIEHAATFDLSEAMAARGRLNEFGVAKILAPLE